MKHSARPAHALNERIWSFVARTGSVASVLSALVLLWHGRSRLNSEWSLINAPSQWVHGRKALRQRNASWRYSALGAGIHHVSSFWWAWVYARLLPEWQPGRGTATSLAVGVTVLAWWVDTRLVPRRMAPGFDRLAAPWALGCVYGAFALGLVWGAQRQTQPCEHGA